MTTMEIDHKTNTIHINRGNALAFDYSIINGDEPYDFGDLDVIGFGIYEAFGMDKEPVVYKEFTTEGRNFVHSIRIQLTKEEMKFGELSNQQITYWYEITLNGETMVGYEKGTGPKKLILYPEGYRPDGFVPEPEEGEIEDGGSTEDTEVTE